MQLCVKFDEKDLHEQLASQCLARLYYGHIRHVDSLEHYRTKARVRQKLKVGKH